YVAEKVGVRWTVLFGAVMIAVGLALSTGGKIWQLYVGQGLFVGFFGIGGVNAPFFIFFIRLFDWWPGAALPFLFRGASLGGPVWPPVFERAIAYTGWRETMLGYGLLELVIVVPLAIVFLRRPPELSLPEGTLAGGAAPAAVLGWRPNLVFALMASAVVFCCIPM